MFKKSAFYWHLIIFTDEAIMFIKNNNEHKALLKTDMAINNKVDNDIVEDDERYQYKRKKQENSCKYKQMHFLNTEKISL